MQNAGLQADIARLERLRAAHIDDQFAVRSQISRARAAVAQAERRMPLIEAAIARRLPTAGDDFRFRSDSGIVSERKNAGAMLLQAIRKQNASRSGSERHLGSLGGFDLHLTSDVGTLGSAELTIAFDHGPEAVTVDAETSPLGLVARIEHRIAALDGLLVETRARRNEAERRLPAYEARLSETFAQAGELAERQAEMDALEADMAKGSDTGGAGEGADSHPEALQAA